MFLFTNRVKTMPKTTTITSTVYPFTVTTIEGVQQSMNAYRGKVLLIVNTASDGIYTSQYKELEVLYKLYRDRGFEILAFPSNDFGKQEQPNNLHNEYTPAHFRTTFPVFEKVVVKGKNAIPLFRFLSHKSENGRVNIAPKWNFQKYLINREGEVVDYFFPFTKPTSERVKKAIEKLL